LPCGISFHDTPPSEWEIGPAKVRAEAVTHRGPTLGYRITDGPTTLTYISDHEPGLGAPLESLEPEWISGYDLARDADLLIHDCQYTDDEYPEHVGWGHSRLTDTLTFARRVEAQRLLLFHHDPLHSDEFLDRFHAEAQEAWSELGGSDGSVEMAAEAQELEVGAPAAARPPYLGASA
jgi:phosphoribosyl 1,2-cyclic phosphodiesterase